MPKTRIVDALRTELRRQAKNNPDLMVSTADKPDNLYIVGEVDLYQLAKAVNERE